MADEKTVQFGRDKILYFRLLEEAGQKGAAKLALQVEHTLNEERSSDTKATKDGQIVTQGNLTTTLEITAVSTLDEVNKMLYRAFREGLMLEIWEVNLNDKREAEDTFGAKYMRGKLASWSLPANVEDTVDISTTVNVEGTPQEGKVKVDKQTQTKIAYAFRDLEKVIG